MILIYLAVKNYCDQQGSTPKCNKYNPNKCKYLP